ncbi:MAG TPA: KaiC domain-containing protein, partial [Nautiliaceae bacterium]|nr:KaiC domain-containing protein [Nautiliaceae bacterium]
MSQEIKKNNKNKIKPFFKTVFLASELKERMPKLFGISTGVEGLDNLFFKVEFEGDKAKKVPLGGIPYLSVTNITGISDTGKSLLAEQFAINQAINGYKVLFVTVESPAPFLASSLRQRALAMGHKWEDLENNIVIIDAAVNDKLRENLDLLIKTIDFAINKYQIKSTIIDSVTGLFESKEMLARSIVRKLFNFMKLKRQTALFVSQKRSSHEELSAEAAGGYAISHIVDCSIVLSKLLITNKHLSSLYKKEIGSIIRFLRIDGCRLCGHDTRTWLFDITETGLIKLLKPLDGLVF